MFDKLFKKKDKIRVGNYSDDYKYENRYRIPIKISASQSAIEDARKNYFALVEKNLKNLQSVKNRADGMKYFDHMIADSKLRAKELSEFKTKGGKLIGVFCVQVPEELIYAAGCVPIRLECGFYDSVSIGEEIVPSNCCPVVRASIGYPFLKIDPFFDMCDVVVLPTTCDAKKKMAEVLSNYKTVWTMELPQNRDHLEARDLFKSQVEIFKKKLERLTGRKVTRKNLEAATKLLMYRTRVCRDFLEVKKSDKIVINGRDTLLVFQTAFSDDIHRWMRSVQVLTNELKSNISNNKTIAADDAERIMASGSPMTWPTWKVLDCIEDNNAVVVIDDSCAGTQYFYNTVEVSDWAMGSMITAIADKYLLPTICPVFVHSDDRVDRILELFEQYKVHGLVYHLIRLCEVMDFEFNKISHVLRQKNTPVLKVETELGEEDRGQIKTRVEAFVEMIKARREE